MAAETRKDVELHIRARDYSRKTFNDVTTSLEKLVKQQDEQLESAKRGEVGLKALEAAYGRLESAGKALLQQNAVVESFKAQAEALEQTKTRVDAARRSHQAYAEELAKSETPTRTQVRELNKLASALKAAERAQQTAEGRLARTSAQMEKYGLSADDVAGAQDKLAAAVAQVNRALEAQDKAIESLDDDTKAAKEREAFEKTRAENLRRMREAEVNQIWQVALAERDAIDAARQAEQNRRDELARSATALDNLARKYADMNRVAAQSMDRQDTGGPSGNVEEDMRRAQAAYDRQIEVVRRLREDYRITREQARELADQMRSGAISSDDARAKMEVLTRSLATTSGQFQNATKVARENRTELARATQAVNKDAAARAAQRTAVLRAADDADTLRRRYAELARAGDSASIQNLQQSIREIINPTQEAAKTIEGLETNVEALSSKIGSIRGPVRDYKATLDGLNTSMKTATTIAGQIDGYRAQLEAVGAARREYVAARDAVRNLANQLRESTAPTSELTQQMTGAQSRLKQAADQMRNTTERAREMRQGLRDVGVDTRNLTDAEAKLTAQAQKLNTAMGQLTDAYKKNGAAAESAGGSISKWFGGQRTTLSYFQRMRGEVLALATGFVGVQSAVNLAGSALDAYRSKQAIESRLSVVVGNDAKAIRDEWNYLMGQSNRLGFSFEDLAMSYSKFGVAAKASGSSQQEIRFIFERIAEGARVAKMTTDDFNGSLKAIEQMMSKGQITAEELRQQLGDRLPGAMAMAAKGAGYTIAEFSKMMEQGQISSDFVINLAREVGASVEQQLDAATRTMVASEGRFKTAAFEFRLALAEGGFVDAYTTFIEKLTAVLRSDDGQKLAQTLSDAFTMVVRALQWAAENVDILAIAFGGLMAVNVIGWLVRLHGTIRTIGTAFSAIIPAMTAARTLFMTTGASATGMAAAMGASTAAVGGLSRALLILVNGFKLLARFIPVIGPAIAVAWGAWDLYKYMSEGVEEDAKEAGKDAGEAAAKGFEEGVRTADPGTGGTTDMATLRSLRKTLGQMDERTRKADAQSRLRQEKSDLDARLDIVSEEYEAMKNMARANVKDQEELSAVLEEIETSRLKRVAVERRNFETEQARAAERGGSKRVSLARQVADELNKIEDELAKNQTAQNVGAGFEERLQTRLAAVGHEYDKLRQKIEALARTDKAAAADAAKRLDVYVETRKQIEEHKVRQEELNRLEGKVNEHLNARTAMLAEVNALYKAGIITQEEALARTIDITRTMSDGATEAIAKLREFATTMQSVLSPASYKELMAKIGTMSVTNDPETTTATAQMEEAETRLNNLLDQRSAILDTIAAKRKQGLIDDFEAARLSEEANGRFRNEVQEAALAVENFAMALRNPANAGAMDLLIAKMQQIRMEADNTRTSFTYLDTTITNSLVNNAMSAIEGVGQALANMISGQESVSEGFRSMGIAAANFFAQFLKDIAMAILRQQLLNALTSMGGGIGGVAKSLGGVAGGSGGIFGMIAGLFHDGGTVGSYNPATARTGSHKRVSPAIFNNAPRMHTGGLVGLSRDEVPTILQENEEVLAKDDPRNILNGGAAAGGTPGAANMDMKMVIVDDPNRIPEAMTGAAGQQVMMAFLKQNAASVRALLKG